MEKPLYKRGDTLHYYPRGMGVRHMLEITEVFPIAGQHLYYRVKWNKGEEQIYHISTLDKDYCFSLVTRQEEEEQ